MSSDARRGSIQGALRCHMDNLQCFQRMYPLSYKDASSPDGGNHFLGSTLKCSRKNANFSAWLQALSSPDLIRYATLQKWWVFRGSDQPGHRAEPCSVKAAMECAQGQAMMCQAIMLCIIWGQPKGLQEGFTMVAYSPRLWLMAA
eukprot:654434-Pelagomonas_calceolata.AAC.1